MRQRTPEVLTMLQVCRISRRWSAFGSMNLTMLRPGEIWFADTSSRTTSPYTPGATRQWGSSVIDEAETLVNRAQTLDLPTISFLDSSILQYGHIDLPHPNPPIPDHVLHLLGDTASLRATATKFFKYIHVWLPFISKPRFCTLHLPPAAPPHLDSWHSHTSADTILLHLSLLLITTLPPTNPRIPQTELYRAIKHFYLDVEQTGILSLAVVQAGVLISLYELGQGIYPDAYLSIAACARYAYVLGIGISEHDGTQTRKSLTQVEMDESRRAWWAIVILDRYFIPPGLFMLTSARRMRCSIESSGN